MNCKECNSPIPDKANFCPHCGQNIAFESKPKYRKSAVTKESSSLSKPSNAYAFILLAVIVAFIAVVLILNSNKEDKEITKNANTTSNALDLGDEFNVLNENLLDNPESLSLNIEMGNQLFDIGRFKESIPFYRKALVLDPSNVAVQIDMAVCYFNIKNIENAILEMDKALKMDPEHTKGLFNMGIIYFNAGKVEKAREYWGRLIVLHPESGESQRAQEILNSM